MLDVRALAIQALSAPTERDKQISLGASDFSTPCTYCLGRKLAASAAQLDSGEPYEPHRQHYWMGAVQGTAIHNYLEQRVPIFRPDAIIEEKITLGTLEGYGTIGSRPDLYLDETVVDWKTTSKEKLKFIIEALTTEPDDLDITPLSAARFTTTKYLTQAHSYARGLVLAGHSVKWVALCFIVRGGLTDHDIWAYTEDYKPDYAQHAWERLEKVWAYVRDGKDIEALPKHEACTDCAWRER